MGFGMTPATGWPVPTDGDFPTFIQFQEDGVNLGGPDADTVNFSTGLTATRGEGESANVITVTSDGGGSAASELAFTATAAGSFNGVSPSSFASTTFLNLSTDVSWFQDFAQLLFDREGVYEIAATVRVSAAGEDVFPQGFVWFGTNLTNAATPSPTKHVTFSNGAEQSSDRNGQCFTDVILYDTANGTLPTFQVYAESDSSPGTSVSFEVGLRARYIGAGIEA